MWVTLKAHDNDTGLTGAWATATWLLDYDSDTPKGYQMFRSLPCPFPPFLRPHCPPTCGAVYVVRLYAKLAD